ncbi:sterol desaturase family protein [Pelomonas sp. UHG3]|uniref:Sterol desaturase family protein n=1 Tax=Roseateles hydrophilus TaxID=2975054 RepID=A0ACC6CE03_9BURK|nr:sterol desaturase family protein [Pelomonas sp. UHG3]MCY4746620.1 sterol desaturase family protein [Pelomonas sp. UHG3]
MDWISNTFDNLQLALYEHVVQPVVFGIGLGNLLEDAFAATGWLLLGLLQIAIMLLGIRLLERRWPVEPLTDRAAVRTDVAYTLIHRLGLVRLAMFFSIEPLWDAAAGQLRLAGLPTWQLDALWPGVTDIAWVSLLLYLVAFDFVGYWLHRWQHGWHWWWALHSLHHSQRQMTMWSDNRNHLLDDIIVATVFAMVARFIGVEPGQFVAITVITQLHESLQHANLRLHFGRVGERLLVSPRFHRLHHSIGIGHEADGRGTLGGHNFGVLLPVWDQLFGTANFDLRYDPTGVRDQLPEEGGRDYGRGFWRQQWLGLVRLVRH